MLFAAVAACLLLGLIRLGRNRAWSVLAFVAISYVVWDFLTHRGTNWTDAKLLMLLSPVVMLTALIGAFGLMDARRRTEGLVLAGAIVFGVLASDALLYHATNMAPTQRYVELSAIGARFAGQGPTLTPDFDEYALYALRDMRDDSPGLAYPGPFQFVRVAGAYGHSYDLDALALPSVERFPTTHAPLADLSRPPSNYVLVWSGPYYTVWRRSGPAPPASSAGATAHTSPRRSRTARGAAWRMAQRHGERLAYAARPLNAWPPGTASHPRAAVTDPEGRPR